MATSWCAYSSHCLWARPQPQHRQVLSNGSTDITAYAEGFVWPDDPESYYRFGIKRDPRTIAGTTQGGDLLPVAVNGHRPGYSLGASFEEEAAIMDAVGAEVAVNLDGGSTTMTIGDELVSTPSDPTGERPVGDAVVLLRLASDSTRRDEKL